MPNGSRRHPEKALSAALVRNAKGPAKYYDGNGLFLRVEASGTQRWVQRITVKGKQREVGLGSASLVSLADAREQALANRKVARAGGDPMQAKRDAEAVMTFAEAARAVHEARRPTWSNSKHAAQFTNTLETYVFPHLGRAKVCDVTASDVLSALAPVWTAKPATARRVLQRISIVMTWCIAKGWLQHNPASAVALALPKHTARPAHRKALDYREVGGFLEAVRGSRAGAMAKLALELLVLTACRSGEVRIARWDEINLTKAEWLIPASRMKAKVEHRVPLCLRAIEVLQAARALNGGKNGLEKLWPSSLGRTMMKLSVQITFRLP